MFKKLREKVAEEVANARLTVNNSNSLQNLTNIISPSNNNGEKYSEETTNKPSAASIDAFSITEEEDTSLVKQSNDDQSQSFQSVDLSEASAYSTPKERSESSSSLFQETHFLPTYTPTLSYHSIQSDLESASEYEDSSTTLEKISKEQLFHSFMRMRSRYTMCRSKYKEVVKAYKEQANEKEKIKSILSESQDKALRRISELKEESLLDKHAKADMEDNFRIMLEEKDELIHVLQTQVKLLKNGVSSEESKLDPSMALILDKLSSENSSGDNVLNQCITVSTNIEKDDSSYALLENRCKELEEQLEEMKIEEREAALTMAETKRQMHEELERKECSIIKMKHEIDHLTKTVEECEVLIQKTEELRQQELTAMKQELVNAEKTLEDEKQALVQELSRGKSAAIALLKEQFEHKINDLHRDKEAAIASEKEHWKNEKQLLKEEFDRKLQDLIISKNNEKEHALHLKDEEVRRKLVEKQEEMNLALEERDLQKLAALSAQDLKIDEFHHCIKQLKKDKNELKDTLRDLEIQNAEIQNKLVKQINELREKHMTELCQIKEEHNLYCQELQKKMDDLEAKLTEFNNLKELHTEIESKTFEIENSFREKEEQLKCSEISVKELTHSLTAAREEIARQISKATKQQEMWDNEKKNFTKDHQNALKQLMQIKSITSSFQCQFKKLLSIISIIKQEKATCKEEIQDLNKQVLSYKNDFDHLLTEISAIEVAKDKTIEDLNRDLNSKQTRETFLSEQVESLTQHNEILQHSLSDVKMENENMKNVLENFQIAADEQSQHYTYKMNELKNHILQLEDDKNFLHKKIHLKEEQLMKLNCELEQAQESLRNEEMQLSIAVSERLAAEECIHEARRQLEEEKSQSLVEREHFLEKLNNSKSNNSHMSELNKLKDELNAVTDEKNILSVVTQKLEKEAVKVERELNEKNKNLEKAILEISSLSEQNEKEVEIRKCLQQELEFTKSIVKEKEVAFAELQNQKDEAMSLLSSTETKLLEVNEAIAAKMEMMENKDVLLRQELAGLRLQMNINNESYQKDIQNLKIDLEISADKLNKIETEKYYLEVEIDALKSELERKQLEIEEMKKEREAEFQKHEEDEVIRNKKMNEIYINFIFKVSNQFDLKYGMEATDNNFEACLNALYDNLLQKFVDLEEDNKNYKTTVDEYKYNFEMKTEEIVKLKQINDQHMLTIKDFIKPSVERMRSIINELSVEVKQQNENFNKYRKDIQNEFNQKLQSLKSILEDEKIMLDKELKLSKEQENNLNELLEKSQEELKKCQNDNERLNIILAELLEEANKTKISFLQDIEALHEQSRFLETSVKAKEISLNEMEKCNKSLQMTLEQQQETITENMKISLDKYQRDLEEVENHWKMIVNDERQAFQTQLITLEGEKSKISKEYENKISLFLVEKNNLLSEFESLKISKKHIEIKLENTSKEYETAKENMQHLVLNNTEMSEKIKILQTNNGALETSLLACKQCIRNLACVMRKKITHLKTELSLCEQTVTENRNSFLTLEKEHMVKISEMSQLLLMQVEYINYLKSKLTNFEKEVNEREIITCNLSYDLENVTKELNHNQLLAEMSVANDAMQTEIVALNKRIEELEAVERSLSESHTEEIELMQQKHSANVQLQLNELKKRAEIKLGQIKKQLQASKDEEITALLNKQKASDQEFQCSKEKYEAQIRENEEVCQLLKEQIKFLEKKITDREDNSSKTIEEITLQKDKIIDELSSHCNSLENKIIDLQKNYELKSPNIEKTLEIEDVSLKQFSLQKKDVDVQCSLDENIYQDKSAINLQYVNITEHVNQKIKENISLRNNKVFEDSENNYLADQTTELIIEELNLLKEENKELSTKLKKQTDEISALKKKSSSEFSDGNTQYEIHEKFNEDNNKHNERKLGLLEQNQALKEELEKLKLSFNNNSAITEIITNYEEKLSNAEEEHIQKIKQLVRDFSLQMEKKDEEFEDRISDLINKEQQEKARLLMEHKNQVVEIQENLEQKEESMEKILQTERIDFKKREEKLKCIINDYEEKLNHIQAQHNKELENLEKHWKATLLKQQQKLIEQHEDEVQGLTDEWKQERMPQIQETISFEPQSKFKQMNFSVELEKENMLTMAAVTSGSDTNELLRKQIISLNSQMNSLKQQYQAEVEELRSLLQSVNNNQAIGNSSCTFQTTSHLGPLLTESTEIEYLRNILFHYMMGRQTLTLAKVIAAVVKFNDEQTKEILEKEETKNNLLMNFLKSS